MALPQRQEYDLEGAAEYLGCSTGDILYYLDKGLLRLSVSTEHSPDFVSVLFEKLSAAVQQLLQSLYNPDGIDLSRIKLDQASLDAGGAVSSLYLTHHQRNKIKDTVHELGEPIWIFQDLTGEQITIWYEGSLRGFWLYEEGGWIANTFLAVEELDRFSNRALDLEIEVSEGVDRHAKGLPFGLPSERSNDIARIMVEYGNQFFVEFGVVPTPDQLVVYLEKRDEETGFRVRDEDEKKYATGKGKLDFEFNGDGLSRKRFGARYSEYLNNPG